MHLTRNAQRPMQILRNSWNFSGFARNGQPIMDCLKVRMKRVNPHITCYICKGYFVDATTVIDCLHTFCRSCLYKHFETDKRCPKCESLVHQSHPSHYVSFDRTMQDIVYKLVPNMHEEELKRRIAFHKDRGIPYEDEETLDEDEQQAQASEAEGKACEYHKNDEQVNLLLTCDSATMKKIKRRYIRCPTQTTVLHLKKYLAKKLYFDITRFKEIDILCNSELMGRDHSLKFIQRTRWRLKAGIPLELQYRKHVDF